MICGAGFRHTSLSSLPGVSPPASSASSGETLLAANTTFRLSGTLDVFFVAIDTVSGIIAANQKGGGTIPNRNIASSGEYPVKIAIGC